MDNYSLSVDSPIKGGYFSSEQIDLLSIIQCQSIDELIKFITNCDQINHAKGILESINGLDLETAKRSIFKKYQDTMVYHNQGLEASRINRFNYLGINSEEELMAVINKTHPRSQEILELNHHFTSDERDQIKSVSYEEMELLNAKLGSFNSMLIGCGKINKVINKYDTNKETKYDFYYMKRALEFALKNGKQVRFHSLLVKDDGKIFDGKSKEEIMEIIKEYVKQCIDFINEYNSSHKVIINGKEEPVINAVDLFNEIVSFDKNAQGEYYNIWEQKYGITMPELMSCFEYALANKPNNVSYLYNEPFLEDEQRRKKVFETLSQITPGLIDTLGTQTHVTIPLIDTSILAKRYGELDDHDKELVNFAISSGLSPVSDEFKGIFEGKVVNKEKVTEYFKRYFDYKKNNKESMLNNISKAFADFKKLQDVGINIQITEFDLSIASKSIDYIFGNNPDLSLEDVYRKKDDLMVGISNVINESGVKLSGVSYWSLTDGIDCNLERVRSNALKEGKINNPNEIPTVCGGLIPTHKRLIKKNEINLEDGNTRSGIHM